MSNEIYDKFTKSLSNFIQTNQELGPPIILGYITSVSSNRKFADVQITAGSASGVLSSVPCKGFPVVGDTVTVLFIGNNYEQAVCDCPRSLPIPDEDLLDYYGSQCYNYVYNGNFASKSKGFTGDFEIYEGESFSEDNDYACLLSESSKSIIFNVDISDCTSDYFKFQMDYMGLGQLTITCKDTDTNKLIPTLPLNISHTSKTWIGTSRWVWQYNKEVYPRVSDETTHKHIQFTITNTSKEVTDENRYVALLLDCLLVYDENGDENYYNSQKDVENKI